ncbi:hypothetical protein CWS35_36535 [Bradyrhizobium sp. SK17]|uniref:hypothetical protein n=1 Tax=Bradyrhizobium sp. SK17 TaxID=2057741 RepID=UPI000C314CF3|nr:hypothetical protein [Bradyrhizobium sp. SK17]AUC99143.1 hypothetical protein CWS35_36535 [Bradyrhizobium sp. SK17]
MESFLVRSLSEEDLDTVVVSAGGRRAHPDADRRDRVGADYVLAEAIVELKSLDEEGLKKPVRQRKLAELFRKHREARPVVVIDREVLPDLGKREYDRIIAGPIKQAVASARKQLEQSRKEYSETSTNILFVLNNGYSALSHERLLKLVWERAKNDSQKIDGVVVAGCYFHSDSFDSYFLWPMDYRPINLERPFPSYEKLRKAWNELANKFMADLMQVSPQQKSTKTAVADLCFDYGGVTYVKPAPILGEASMFFVNGRPRAKNADRCPPVATTFADMSRETWQAIHKLPGMPLLSDSYEEWLRERGRAASSDEVLRPFVPIPVGFDDWMSWCSTLTDGDDCSVGQYANRLFDERARHLLLTARERSSSSILPSRYIFAITEFIGQDQANDISHVLDVRELPHGEPSVRVLVENARIGHLHAVAVAAAYAVLGNAECVMWQKDLRYGWV